MNRPLIWSIIGDVENSCSYVQNTRLYKRIDYAWMENIFRGSSCKSLVHTDWMRKNRYGKFVWRKKRDELTYKICMLCRVERFTRCFASRSSLKQINLASSCLRGMEGLVILRSFAYGSRIYTTTLG